MICVCQEDVDHESSDQIKSHGLYKEPSAGGDRRNSHYSRYTVKHQRRASLSVAQGDEPVVEMESVRLHDGSSVDNSSDDGIYRIKDGEAHDQYGDDDRDQGGLLDQTYDR